MSGFSLEHLSCTLNDKNVVFFFNFSFCDHLKKSNNVQVLCPYLPAILEGLVTLAVQFSSEVLALVLEAIAIVITVSIFYYLFLLVYV